MVAFNKGDMVVRKDQYKRGPWDGEVAHPDEPYFVEWCNGFTIRLVGLKDAWDADKFELYSEPQPEPVTVTEPPVQQIPGVPDGYRLVRIGAPKKGEQFITVQDEVFEARDDYPVNGGYAIVEPIVPPAPPTPIPTTVKVQLNRYLVGDLHVPATLFVLEATEEYIENNYGTYRLLGPSETLELEVEV
jgi:hypothetical protein